MKTNDLKKGQRIKLRNGWEAVLKDNMRGNRRLAEVYGWHTETGSVYSHDIAYYYAGKHEGKEQWVNVQHTPAQMKLREELKAMGF